MALIGLCIGIVLNSIAIIILAVRVAKVRKGLYLEKTREMLKGLGANGHETEYFILKHKRILTGNPSKEIPFWQELNRFIDKKEKEVR